MKTSYKGGLINSIGGFELFHRTNTLLKAIVTLIVRGEEWLGTYCNFLPSTIRRPVLTLIATEFSLSPTAYSGNGFFSATRRIPNRILLLDDWTERVLDQWYKKRESKKIQTSYKFLVKREEF